MTKYAYIFGGITSFRCDGAKMLLFVQSHKTK
jgi:hypothetical protein